MTTDDLYNNESETRVEGETFFRTWRPPAGVATRARLFLFHGLHEHSGRYAEFAHGCAKRGIAVFTLDFRGHGRSPSYETAPGDIGAPGWRGLVESAVGLVRAESGGGDALPCVVFGHSMGALVAFHCVEALRHDGGGAQPDAVVLSGIPTRAGPAAAAPFGFQCLNCIPLHCSRFATAIADATAALAPQAPNSPIDGSKLTHDGELMVLVARDHYHNKRDIKNRTAASLLHATANFVARSADFGAAPPPAEAGLAVAEEGEPRPFRLLVVHGARDTLAYPSGARRLFAACPLPDSRKRYIEYPDLYHELLNELPEDRARVMADIFAFLEEALQS